MTTTLDLERQLDHDPLARRLAHLDLPEPSAALWGPVLAAAAAAHAQPQAQSRGRALRRRSVIGGAAVAVVTALAVSPAGVAIARSVLPDGLQQRLGIVEGAPTQLSPPGGSAGSTPARRANTSPIPCSQVPTPRPDLGGIAYDCFPDLSLAEAQRQVGFAIPTPAALPPGLVFHGALVDAGKPAVFLTYGDAQRRHSVGLWVTRGTPVGGSAVPSGTAQSTTVDGGQAWYVHGSYGDAGGPGTAPRWNPSNDDEELTWQQGGFTFDLTAAGLHYGAADMVRLAESVRQQPLPLPPARP